MSQRILPSSARPFTWRSQTNVELGPKVPQWLRKALNRVKQPGLDLSTVSKKREYLANLLSSEHAIWTLCSFNLAKEPDEKLRGMNTLLVEAFRMVHINAYVVDVGISSKKGNMIFKLDTETIEALVKFHKDVHLVNYEASISRWSDKQAHLRELDEKFVWAVHNFVFQTSTEALEELDEGGTAMLSSHESETAQAAILDLFLPERHFYMNGHHPLHKRTELWNLEPSIMTESLDFHFSPLDHILPNNMPDLNLNLGFEVTSGDAGTLPSLFQNALPPPNSFLCPDSLQLEWPSVIADRMEEVSGIHLPGYLFPTQMSYDN